MNRKHILRRLTVLLLTALLIPFSSRTILARAAETGTNVTEGWQTDSESEEDTSSGWEGNLYFVIQDGQAILTDCQEDAVKVTIPAQFRGCPVTEIGVDAFAWCEKLTQITIPKNIQKIRARAFSYATKLTKVSFGGELTEIGREAFAYCYSLKTIELPKGITVLPSRIFYQCLSLKKVTVPSGVTTIESGVFANCPALEAVLLPKTIAKLDSYNSLNSGSSYVIYTDTEKDPVYQEQDSFNRSYSYNSKVPTVHFLPIAKAPTLDKTQKGVLALTWKSRGNAIAGYEIEYAKDKNFTKEVKTVKYTLKKPNASGSDTVKKTLKDVKSKETWYVRIRAYETCSGTKVYGKYSKVTKMVVP